MFVRLYVLAYWAITTLHHSTGNKCQLQNTHCCHAIALALLTLLSFKRVDESVTLLVFTPTTNFWLYIFAFY